jgi:hypothetical protein
MLANGLIEADDHETALEVQERALKIRLQALGETNPRTADLYFNLGATHLAMGHVQEAINLL